MLQKRNSVVGLVLLLIASLLTVLSPGRAVADSGIAWSTNVDSTRKVTSPTGSVTIPCEYSHAGGRDLVTYDANGQVVRRIPYAQVIDSVENCIDEPVVDKNDVLYGIPHGKRRYGGTGYAYGANLLAYKGNALLWKYPVNLAGAYKAVTIGANGNVYVKVHASDGDHLVGLDPKLSTGATQPRKVLDVKLSFDVTFLHLMAYRDGIVLEGGLSPNQETHFVSYGGAYLGKSPIHPMDGVLNAEGKLFIPNLVNYQYNYGDSYYTDATVSMFEPRKGVIWTRSVVTPGARARGVYLSALQNGGVVATVTESRMVAGAPVRPTEWVHRLVTLDYNGRQIQSVALPSEDSAGNKFTTDAFWAIADGAGKVAVLQTTHDSITVDTYEAMTGKQSYHTSLPGRSLYYTGAPALASGTLLFSIDCDGCQPTTQMVAVRISGIGMDYPRSAVLAGGTGVPYVAMGDSYSSGEGVEPFEASSNTSTNKCHRSESAYSKQVSRSPAMTASLILGKFVACSGAETKHITGRWSPSDSDPDKNLDEAPQIDALNKNTKYVSLTIGGNDMGFVDFGKACILPATRCGLGSSAYNRALGRINNVLPARLTSIYKAILAKAPNAKIYVLGYPQVAPVKSPNDPDDFRCHYLWDGKDAQGRWGDARGARAIVATLNAKIKTTVDAVRAMNVGYAQRLKFIDVNASGSPFIGHTTCSDPYESYFNNVDQWFHYDAYTLHPNSRGQLAYAKLLTREMSK